MEENNDKSNKIKYDLDEIKNKITNKDFGVNETELMKFIYIYIYSTK